MAPGNGNARDTPIEGANAEVSCNIILYKKGVWGRRMRKHDMTE